MVIPLPRMGDYCDGIERINIELSTPTSSAVRRPGEFLAGAAAHRGDAATPRWYRRSATSRHCSWPAMRAAGSGCWTSSTPAAEAEAAFDDYGVVAGEQYARPRRCSIARKTAAERTSWKTELKPPLDKTFDGKVFSGVCAIEAARAEVLRGRLFVACIRRRRQCTPTSGHSDHYRMLQTAYRPLSPHHGAVTRQGDLRRARHRHHQPTILEQEEIRAFVGPGKKKVDPNGALQRAAS